MNSLHNYNKQDLYFSKAEVEGRVDSSTFQAIGQEAENVVQPKFKRQNPVRGYQKLTPIVLGVLVAGLGIASTGTAGTLFLKEVVVLNAGWRFGIFAITGGMTVLGVGIAGIGAIAHRYRSGKERKERLAYEKELQCARTSALMKRIGNKLINIKANRKGSPAELGFIWYEKQGYWLIRTAPQEIYPQISFESYTSSAESLQARACQSYSQKVSTETSWPKELVPLESLKEGGYAI